MTNWQTGEITTNGYVPITDFVLDQGGALMPVVAVSTGVSGLVDRTPGRTPQLL